MTNRISLAEAAEMVAARRHPRPWNRNYITLSSLLVYLTQTMRAIGLSERSDLRVLDAGCGTKPYRILFPRVPDKQYFGIDIESESRTSEFGPDILADGAKLPFPDSTFDVGTLLQVLTHVPEPQQFAAEMSRVLKPGGWLICSGHGMWPVLGEASVSAANRWRWTNAGWHAMLTDSGLEVVSIKPADGAATTFGQLSCLFADRIVSDSSSVVRAVKAVGFSAINLGTVLIDRVLNHSGGDFATINYIVVARKPIR